MEQSEYVYHVYARSLNDIIDCLDIEFDNRDKIEDLDKFKRELRNILDETNYKKFEDFLPNYLKFEND